MTASAYIHIPFCHSICHYCDFTKFLYQEKWVVQYLQALENEIKTYYEKNPLKTIYVGGGTPTAFKEEAFESLLKITNQLQKQETYEYTIECNIESLTETKIQMMQQYGVNRISIGVETFHPHHLQAMNRQHTKEQVKQKIDLLKQHGFTNINIDFIYALPNETLEEVKEDIEAFLKLDVPHIATYSLMIEPNTTFYIQNVEPVTEELDAEMYHLICQTLKEHNYEHYEISNFSRPGYASKHNLTYWNNEEYYGFGLGASGFQNQIRYTNTHSFTAYCKHQYRFLQEQIGEQTNMENEMILGLRKLEGVDLQAFYQKYHKKVEEVFPIQTLQKKGQLHIQNGRIQIDEDQLYISNSILVQLIGDQNESNHS